LHLVLSEEQKLLQKSVREFAESEVRPLAKENDETGQIHSSAIRFTGMAPTSRKRNSCFPSHAVKRLVAMH
jgi:alkylation response protein AidB-like acyl-CoA dehydrogenase